MIALGPRNAGGMEPALVQLSGRDDAEPGRHLAAAGDGRDQLPAASFARLPESKGGGDDRADDNSNVPSYHGSARRFEPLVDLR